MKVINIEVEDLSFTGFEKIKKSKKNKTPRIKKEKVSRETIRTGDYFEIMEDKK